MAGEIVHLEFPSSDFARSAAFYEKLFGWKTDGQQSGGHLRFELPGDVQGSWIRNALAQAPGPVPFVAVTDVDKALELAERNGGRVLVRRLGLGDRGVFGLLADADGNVVGVLAPRTGAAAAPRAPKANETAEPDDAGGAAVAAKAPAKPAPGKAAPTKSAAAPKKAPAKPPRKR